MQVDNSSQASNWTSAALVPWCWGAGDVRRHPDCRAKVTAGNFFCRCMCEQCGQCGRSVSCWNFLSSPCRAMAWGRDGGRGTQALCGLVPASSYEGTLGISYPPVYLTSQARIPDARLHPASRELVRAKGWLAAARGVERSAARWCSCRARKRPEQLAACKRLDSLACATAIWLGRPVVDRHCAAGGPPVGRP